MGQYAKHLKRVVLEFIGLKYTDREWEEVYNKGNGWGPDFDRQDTTIALSQTPMMQIGMVESNTVEIPYFKKSAVEYFLMSNMSGLKFKQSFKHSKKQVGITILSKLESGTLDQQIMNDPEAEGFLYFLDLPKVSSKPMYISIPDLAVKLLSGDWIETTGALKSLL